jgi:hypothetical protein
LFFIEKKAMGIGVIGIDSLHNQDLGIIGKDMMVVSVLFNVIKFSLFQGADVEAGNVSVLNVGSNQMALAFHQHENLIGLQVSFNIADIFYFEFIQISQYRNLELAESD